ncbi:peptide/nickel transport system permease protein [Amphibacillus marinus]|uniref:Peptide/nickel transport system permease protein n=1 Tax=Amphibacillus marinus TaxID=872970 RepID=A0A1H8PKT8_9BACI|nr:ABC transporter permease [Amphibacillus marinus]SEO42525.1 peptide/nickel transport system permease protein [Amphibacillus marinus]
MNQLYKKKLKQSDLYKHGHFSFVVSLLLATILLVNSYQFTTQTWQLSLFLIAVAYLFVTIFQLVLNLRTRRDILKYGNIQRKTRLLTAFQLGSLLVGNVFTATYAFRALQDDGEIEYTFAYYMFLADFLIIAVTSFNLFKPYVTNYFIPVVFSLAVLLLLDVIVLIWLARSKSVSRKSTRLVRLLPYLFMVTSLTGNVFRFILGYSLLLKQGKRDPANSERWQLFWIKLTKRFTAMIGLLFVIFTFSLSITSFTTFVTRFAVANDYTVLLTEPSLVYPFGTDNFGRDVFSRIVFGARISLIIGMLTTLIPMIIGGFLGAISGFFHRSLDQAIMRVLDVLYAIPGILLAIAIIAAFGSSTLNLIIALSVGSIPMYARTMRANILMIAHLDFIEAARALGESEWKILFKHAIPNGFAPMIVRATLTIGTAVIATSSLSFLGLGVEPHVPEWGNVLRIGSQYLETEPYLAIFPGLAIILLVLSFNFLGDGLRDALDPKIN